jgi:hypothetical protein
MNANVSPRDPTLRRLSESIHVREENARAEDLVALLEELPKD